MYVLKLEERGGLRERRSGLGGGGGGGERKRKRRRKGPWTLS